MKTQDKNHVNSAWLRKKIPHELKLAREKKDDHLLSTTPALSPLALGREA